MTDRQGVETFWRYVSKKSECWIWLGPNNGNGYGRYCWDGKHYLAHRYAWQVTYGPIPAGMFICHHCDNPLCVRPDHLFLGTHRDNMEDWKRKNRARRRMAKFIDPAKDPTAARRPMTDADRWMSVAEVGEALGLNIGTVYYRLKNGIMQGQQIGKVTWIVSSAEVEYWQRIGKDKSRRKPTRRPPPPSEEGQ